ncbi:MAG: hypothetical protein ACC662_10440, partial [Planctomycetota bacterium]
TLLIFGFVPQAMIGVIHQGVAPLVERLDGAREEAARTARGEVLEPVSAPVLADPDEEAR